MRYDELNLCQHYSGGELTNSGEFSYGSPCSGNSTSKQAYFVQGGFLVDSDDRELGDDSVLRER